MSQDVVQIHPVDFHKHSKALDEAACATPGIDHFCSSSAWIFAASLAFHHTANHLLFRTSCGYLPFALQNAEPWRQTLTPLESTWCLACPLLSADVSHMADCLVHVLTKPSLEWKTCVLAGIPENGVLWQAVLGRLALKNAVLYRGPTAIRRRVDLSNGVDAFLAHRSRKFRKSLRQATRRASQEGISYEYYFEPMNECETLALLKRMMDIEANGWKGLQDQGVNKGSMALFYQLMLPTLAKQGRLRALIGRLGDRDVGYLFGGVLGSTFRGLQFSHVCEVKHLSLGNLMQLQIMNHLVEEGVACYDLGMDMEYKLRWSDHALETSSILIRKCSS